MGVTNETLTPEEELLGRYYKKAYERVHELALDLLQNHVTDYDELIEEEQETLMANAIQDILIDNVDLASFLSYLGQKSREEAKRSLGEGFDNNLSRDETQAIVDEQQLRILQATGLEVNLVTGTLLGTIEATGSFRSHPNDYARLNQMAESAGISISECSDLKAIANIIFPYLENELHLDGRELWRRIGKARFRRITPLLRTMIVDDREGTDRVQKQLEKLYQLAADAALKNVEEMERDEIMIFLLQEAETHTLRNLDELIRPEVIVPFELIATIHNPTSVEITGTITLPELELLAKLIGKFGTIFRRGSLT